MSDTKPYPGLLRRADIERAQGTHSHPWNPNSQMTGTQLARMAGLQRAGVSIVRIAPGKESFVYHAHHTEEEWIYILSGRGVALIDGREYEMEAGDFVGFATPSVAHHMYNRSGEELVYLMGGENHATEIADFPALDKRMVKVNGTVTIYKLSDGKPMGA
jgi:uncharacterized cupin superfamily protein